MSRPKSPLAEPVRNYVIFRLKYYPDDRKQLDERIEDLIPSPVPKYEPKEGGGFNSEQRPAEDVAIRIVNDEYICELRKRIAAIESVLSHLTAEDRELLRLTYWNGELTPDGIAMRLNMATRTYYNHLNSILVAVAVKLGLVSL